MNKVIINRKMFHTRMENRISRDIGGTKVVRKQSRQGLHWDKKLIQRLHPLQFGNNSGNDTILGLTGRPSNSTLLCRTLGNWINIKEYEKNICGGMIIWVTSSVCIREVVQCPRSVYKKPDTKGSCAIKITKQTFDCSPMVFRWRARMNWERRI